MFFLTLSLVLFLFLFLLLLFLQFAFFIYDYSTVDSRIFLASLPPNLQKVSKKVIATHLAVPFIAIYRSEKKINIEKESIISIYKKQMFNTHDIDEWLVKNQFGQVSIYLPHQLSNCHRPSKIGPSIIAYHKSFDYLNNEISFIHKWRNELLPFANKYWQFFFSISNDSIFKKLYLKSNEISLLNINDSSPVIFAFDSLGITYIMEKPFCQLNQFIEQLKEGHVLPFIQSNTKEQLLQQNIERFSSLYNRYLVTQITGKNIHTKISYESKPILLAIYNYNDTINGNQLSHLPSLLSNLSHISFNIKSDYNLITAAFDSSYISPLPIELKIKFDEKVFLLILSKPGNNLRKIIIRYKGKLNGALDDLKNFVIEQLTNLKKNIHFKQQEENFDLDTEKVSEKITYLKSEL